MALTATTEKRNDMAWSATKYQGKWALFSDVCRCYFLMEGGQRECERRAKVLNEEDKNYGKN